jgi:hypothetical protein
MNCGKQGRKFFAIVLLGFFVFGSLFAQQQAGSITRRIGLFVGANEGNYKQPMLSYAQSDAEAVSKIFSELGGINGDDNILLRPPERAYLDYRLDAIRNELADAKRNGQRTELIFYYAGHSSEGYLNLGMQSYATFDLLKKIQNIEADVRIVILDMCYAGGAARGDSPISFDGCTVLTSTKENEESVEKKGINSTYFTHSLITGLRGAADINGDANVSLKELYDFVSREVKIKTDYQNPQFNPKNTGSEETVLTNTALARARFIIDGDVIGRIKIWDNSRKIYVSDLTKENQSSMELAFEFGNYQLILNRDNPSRWVSQRLWENNSNIHLQMKDFFPVGIPTFVNKGTSRGSVATVNSYEPPPGYAFSASSSDPEASTQPIPIKEALLYATNKISANILPGSIIAIDNISENYAELSKYIMSELTTNMDNKGLFKIIPRDKYQLDKINEEVARFLSGNMSDESQISLVGHDLPPDTLITGSIIYTEDTYELYIRAIDLEGKNIRPNSAYSVSILNDNIMQGLTGNRSNSASSFLGGKVNVSPISGSYENNQLYLGLSLGGGYLFAKLNPNPDLSTYHYDFNGAVSITRQMTDQFGIQAGLIYSLDDMFNLFQKKFTVPLLAKFSLRSQDFLFGGLGGVYFSFPIGNMNYTDTADNTFWQYTPLSPSIGIMVGPYFGYHVGPGVLFIDIRFLRDLKGTEYEIIGSNIISGSRIYYNKVNRLWSMIEFSIGYEIGILKKK